MLTGRAARHFISLCWLAAAMTAVNSLFGDAALLRTIGPSSGIGFSNVGSATKAIPPTSLANAAVVITLKAGKGSDLTVDCTAQFDMKTLATPQIKEGMGQVAFPITGLFGRAVTVKRFDVRVNGKSPSDLARGLVNLAPDDVGDFYVFKTPPMASSDI
jgi:hypothetical protein